MAAESGFSGVVRVDRGDEVVVEKAYGLAHRGYGIPNEVNTRLATASATKGLTALAVVSLIESGALELSTTARSVLGADLPLIHDEVTVEHLLAHRSGIGDYLDEDDPVMDLDAYPFPFMSSWRPRTTSPSSADISRSSIPASGSRTATAATSCWR